ncbi:hypothetical protein [Marinobacterium stanieri]|uniref:Uncharacterized protein n=1 Tax=Marinobacterium stanieri TaxID=49186 RepID=A0A1N6Q4J8_9GAMM|nr:hypothetical protein [Marinobacterium stanieri]SIQ11425.1 hypothetical protein SAMN05421647_102247 [Marinobacterium stanieri]
MADYTYKATCTEIVSAVEEFFNAKKQTVKAGHDFSTRFQLGEPGFSRCVVSWDFKMGGVSMTPGEWRDQYRDEWYKPTKGFSTPKGPKKGKAPSEVYEAFKAIPNASGEDLQQALLGNRNSLWAPGLFMYEGAVFITASAELTAREGLVEITQSEYQAVSKEADHG